MPVSFQIYPSRGLVLARFVGHILLEDCLTSAKAYAEHPDANPTQNQLIDLTGVTSYEHDFVRIMSTMAQLPDHLLRSGAEPMVVYIAPSRVAQEITTLVMRSMSGVMGLVVRVVETEAQALEILGVPERAVAFLPDLPGR
jgi:lipid A disaccharide synthetase